MRKTQEICFKTLALSRLGVFYSTTTAHQMADSNTESLSGEVYSYKSSQASVRMAAAWQPGYGPTETILWSSTYQLQIITHLSNRCLQPLSHDAASLIRSSVRLIWSRKTPITLKSPYKAARDLWEARTARAKPI